jgi:hypothetical protein
LQENADERLVICDVGLCNRRVHESQVTDSRSHGGGTDGGARGPADKIAPRQNGKLFVMHKIIFG